MDTDVIKASPKALKDEQDKVSMTPAAWSAVARSIHFCWWRELGQGKGTTAKTH